MSSYSPLLNYTDRVNILRSFRNLKSFQLDGHKLILFADYSQEVSRRRKAFQPICQALFQKGVKFTLAYQATLHFTDPSGDPKSFSHPEEASHYLQAYLHIPMDTSNGPAPPRTTEPRDQRSPRKDPPKRFRFSNSGRNKSC